MILNRDFHADIDSFGTHAAQHFNGAFHMRFDRQRAAALPHASYETSHRRGPHRLGHTKARQDVLTRLAVRWRPTCRWRSDAADAPVNRHAVPRGLVFHSLEIGWLEAFVIVETGDLDGIELVAAGIID